MIVSFSFEYVSNKAFIVSLSFPCVFLNFQSYPYTDNQYFTEQYACKHVCLDLIFTKLWGNKNQSDNEPLQVAGLCR